MEIDLRVRNQAAQFFNRVIYQSLHVLAIVLARHNHEPPLDPDLPRIHTDWTGTRRNSGRHFQQKTRRLTNRL